MKGICSVSSRQAPAVSRSLHFTPFQPMFGSFALVQDEGQPYEPAFAYLGCQAGLICAQLPVFG